MYILYNESVQTGEIGDSIFDIAAQAICANKQLVFLNGLLYYVHKNFDEHIIKLYQLCDNVKET